MVKSPVVCALCGVIFISKFPKLSVLLTANAIFGGLSLYSRQRKSRALASSSFSRHAVCSSLGIEAKR